MALSPATTCCCCCCRWALAWNSSQVTRSRVNAKLASGPTCLAQHCSSARAAVGYGPSSKSTAE
eukprot:1156933-Pelagomonas_calceolata.AAC.2